MSRKSRQIMTTCAVALGCVLAVSVADASPADATRSCSTMRYDFGNAVLNRQQVRNISSSTPFWMYQDHKRGEHSAGKGGATTGGLGKAYCGTNFYHSTQKM